MIDSIVDRKIEGEHNLLCIFPNGSFLLEKNGPTIYEPISLVKICHNTLSTLSTQPWQQSFSASAIDNESFFIIKKNGDWKNQQLDYSLVIYKWNESSYVESNNIRLSIYPLSIAPTNGGHIGEIKNIRSNRYCCTLRGHNTNDFRILIFDIDVISSEVKEIGIIKPKAQYSGSSSSASGSLIVLPNSQLLTYHECHDNIQIWDTETFSCVKEWNWADIQTPKEFSVWCLKILSFPDSIHLLVHKGNNFYLFNTDKLTMKSIELEHKVNCFGKNLILPNGTILAFKHRDNYSNDHMNIMHFDLPDIMNCRKIMTESQHLVRLFFKRSGLPVEITDQIVSYTLTADAKEMLARKIADASDEKENQKCLVM